MPQPESSVTWESTLNRVSEILGFGVPNLDPRWAGICSEVTRQASMFVYDKWVSVGYGAANMQAADQNINLTKLKAVVLAMQLGSTFSQYSAEQLKQIKETQKELDSVLAITISGNPVAPAANESPVGGVSFGRVAAAQIDACEFDRFSGNRFGGRWW
jgi:hypothetical protein